MNLTRRILEGIREVELEITPEFRKGWPKPNLYVRTNVGKGPQGAPRYRVVYNWPDGTMVHALETDHGKAKMELDVWTPMSSVKVGDWLEAVRSLRELGTYGEIWIYGSERVVAKLNDAKAFADQGGPLSGYEVIKGMEPGDDPVVDHFLGYEAKPASEVRALAKTLAVPPRVETVFLSSVVKQAVEDRVWLLVKHADQAVTAYNPVMILAEHMPITMTTAFADVFEGLDLKFMWAPAIQAWKVWPTEEQAAEPEAFSGNMVSLINRIDELVGGEGEAR